MNVEMQIWLWFAAIIVWGVTTVTMLRLRRWLLFYLIGAFGFVLLLAFAAGAFNFDTILETIEARQVVTIATALGMGIDQLGGSGLAIPNHTGWAVFDIGIECSALLEMAAVVGLTIFYPAFRRTRRVGYAVTGVAVTYTANILRILLIVAIINWFGTSWVFAAHAVFGRILFFTITVALYWFIMTRPTIGRTAALVEEANAS
jgi:exosortase family protein XrtG